MTTPFLNRLKGFVRRKLFPTTKSFSQTGEDLILWTMLNGKQKGSYIDVGANDPRRFNNTYLFYKQGWSGINVEPMSSKIRKFNLLRRRDTNFAMGVGAKSGTMTFHQFKEDTLSTFSADVARVYEKMGHRIIQKKDIAVEPLSYFFKKATSPVDILSVDVEGYDMDVLKSNNWNIYRPRFIVLETLEYKKNGTGKKLNAVYDPYMTSIGYTKTADSYINTIYEDTTIKA